jgi:hypothetical protein
MRPPVAVRRRLGQAALAAVGLVIGVVAVLALRNATLSTHERIRHADRTVVVVHASVHGNEHNQTLHESVEALLSACRLEVTSDLEADPLALGDGRFRASLVPALDDTNRRQFRGCVEDWTIDQIRADVVTLESR